MIDEDYCGAIGGMKIGRGNQSTQIKPALAPLRPPQIPHDQTQARTRGRRGGKPATNRLSYGAANITVALHTYSQLSHNLLTYILYECVIDRVGLTTINFTHHVNYT
jgi:hypothetical protein